MDKKFDWLNLWKWVLIIGGGVLTLIGGTILDTIQKNRDFKDRALVEINNRLNSLGLN